MAKKDEPIKETAKLVEQLKPKVLQSKKVEKKDDQPYSIEISKLEAEEEAPKKQVVAETKKVEPAKPIKVPVKKLEQKKSDAPSFTIETSKLADPEPEPKVLEKNAIKPADAENTSHKQ